MRQCIRAKADKMNKAVKHAEAQINQLLPEPDAKRQKICEIEEANGYDINCSRNDVIVGPKVPENEEEVKQPGN